MGILSWIGGPGGWIGDAVKNALTGPLVNGVVAGYKAKLDAGNTQEKLAADLAARELQADIRARELAVQQNQMDNGRWWTTAPRAIVMWSLSLYVAKCVVWDNLLGLGTTDPIRGLIGDWFGMIMIMWFGGRTLEKVAQVFKR